MKELRRVLPYYTPYRGQLIAGLSLVVISTAATALIPWFLRIAIDGLRSGAPFAETWKTAGSIIAVAALSALLRYSMRKILNGISRHLEFDLRNDLFKHLIGLDAEWFASQRTGDIMARLTNDLNAVRMATGPALMYLTNTVAGAIFSVVFMLRIDPLLTLLALLPMVALPMITVYMGALIHRRFDAVQEHFSTMTTHAQENLTGTRIVRAYRQESAEIERFSALNDEYKRRNISLAKLYGTMHPGFALLAGIAGVVVLGFGGLLTLRGQISVGSFVAFGIYLNLLTWPLIALGWVVTLFQRGNASMARLGQILDAKSNLREVPPDEAVHLPPVTTGRSIEFRNVGFHYPTVEGREPRWVFRNVSFTVPAGSTLGIAGATGSGKTALIDLIPRLHDPQEGDVLIDGVRIRDIPIHELRREIGFVPQESLLFSDTIGANLGYGAADHDSVEWAARTAQLADTIDSFAGKYETMLGERGINLSGGQKQRASLARALARRPAIVLLDDALSAVDTHTEAEILRGLRGALAARTAIIASHRASAIRDADWILVLDEGNVVEQGRHDELMMAEGRYWALLRRQQLVESIEEAGEHDLALEGAAGE